MNQQIKSIMRNFDFKRVHCAMVRLDWEWERDGKRYIPSTDMIKDVARNLLVELSHSLRAEVSTGSFVARYDGESLQLSFEVTSWP
jgi:hypothetical protein